MTFQVMTANEWVYPDSRVEADGCREINLTAARGGYAACQILFNAVRSESEIKWEYASASGWPMAELQPEVYQLIDVFVEENTGPVGFVVKPGESAAGYTSRLAPFRVYDAMKPLVVDGRTRSETECLYICWKVDEDASPGVHSGELVVTIGQDKYAIPVRIEVFPARVPKTGTLSIINWFILSHMATRHHLELWSEEHWAMIRRYGELMRRCRQTHFWVTMEVIDVESREDGTYQFHFDKAERLIRLFLELGFTHIEGGMVAVRRQFSDPEFVVTIQNRDVKAISPEGYSNIAQYLTAWRNFLQQHHWLDLLVQHVADEPTPNCADEYRILSGIVRKFLPGVPLIEAVELYSLEGAIDIWIPKNHDYEMNRHEYERMRKLGDKIWFYTCCFPGGHYMNRLLDMPLLRTRYLHWGNYIYNLTGFLHWGFNYYAENQDPFKDSSPRLTNLGPAERQFTGRNQLTWTVRMVPEAPLGSRQTEAAASVPGSSPGSAS